MDAVKFMRGVAMLSRAMYDMMMDKSFGGGMDRIDLLRAAKEGYDGDRLRILEKTLDGATLIADAAICGEHYEAVLTVRRVPPETLQ